MRLLRLVAAALAAALLAVLTAGPAWAHNALVEAEPSKDAKLTAAPEQVRLRFLQKLDEDRTTIAVTDAEGRKVPASEPKADGKAGSITFAEPLPNGVYTVTYGVVSQDGHPVRGTYSFTVNAVAPPTAPSPSPSSSPSAAAAAVAAPASVILEEEKGGPAWLAIAAVIGVIVLVGVAGAALVRRRRS
ncbi:copper resistance CopC family protein [Actinoplanes sp. NPDC049118]|uniref:copper resistance CopC family protein n=1 Tax=Actinoplanes sp. NPDC049118 TaxID=3155769 RepID=UPI0033F4AEDB